MRQLGTPRGETETRAGLPSTDANPHGKTGRISTGPFTLPCGPLCDIPARTHTFFFFGKCIIMFSLFTEIGSKI